MGGIGKVLRRPEWIASNIFQLVISGTQIAVAERALGFFFSFRSYGIRKVVKVFEETTRKT